MTSIVVCDIKMLDKVLLDDYSINYAVKYKVFGNMHNMLSK